MSYIQDQTKSQGQYQSNYIVPTDGVLNSKRNQIVDQRNYSDVVKQTSEGDDQFQGKRNFFPQQFPQGSNIQQSQNVQSSQQISTSTFGRVQSQAPNSYQSQSNFQVSAGPSGQIQSQGRLNNQNGQFQSQPLSQSNAYDRQRQSQSQFQKSHQQFQGNDNQINNSQQYNKETNSYSRSQQNTQPNQFNQQQYSSRVATNPNERPSNNSNINTNMNPNSQQNRSQYEDPKVSQRNNPQSNSRVYQSDNFNSRNRQDQKIGNQFTIEQNNNQDQQFEQVKRSQRQPAAPNQNFERQNSQFPNTHQYYKSSLIEEPNPAPNNKIGQNDFYHYAQFFEAYGFSLDTNVNDEQVLKVLNTSTSQFDLEVLQQLKDEMGNKDSYTVKEFLDIYIKALEVLEDKKAKEESIIKAAKDKLNELINLQEQARIEEQNSLSNRPSILYVYVDQAKGLGRASQYHVKIGYDYNQTVQTTPSNYSSDPSFNQEFKLKINNPNTVLTFKIEDSNNQNTVGLVTQKLKQFYHQKKIDEWYILEDQGGALGDINRQIAIAVQWIHSERQLYENILKENDYFEPHIKDYEEKLHQSVEMIKVLRHPFERDIEVFRQELQEQQEQQEEKTKKAKRGGKQRNGQEIEDEHNEPGPMNDCWTACISLFDNDDDERHDQPHVNETAQAHNNAAVHGQVQSNALTQGYSQNNASTQGYLHSNALVIVQAKEPSPYSSNEQKIQPSKNTDSLLQLKENLVQVYIILAICICFFRPNYIDLCTAIGFYSKLFSLSPENCKRFTIVLIVTIFIDILWMSLFTKNWFKYAGDSIFCMTLFIILEISECMLKIVLALLHMKLKSEMEDQKLPITNNFQHNTNNQQNYQHV